MTPEQRFEENMPLVGFVMQKHFKSQLGTPNHDDLMQEGFIALWRACQTFDETLGCQLSTYAVKAILYAMAGYLKRESRVQERVISMDTVIAEDGEGSEVCLIDTLFVLPEDKSIENLIEFCIGLLKTVDQKIIRVLLDHHTQDETAKICNTSQTTVSRCLKRLRKILLEELKK